MNCLHPIIIPNPRISSRASHTGRPTYFERLRWTSPTSLDSSTALTLEEYALRETHVAVPCRRCAACLRARAAEWRSRLVRETQYHQALNNICHFVTLTYDNTTIDRALTTYKSDMAQFYDRLRSRFRRTIRHFSIGELGEKRGRFHIHLILFDSDSRLDPDSHLRQSSCGAIHGSNSILSSCWSRGIVDIGRLKSFKGCSYLASYITKGSPDSTHRQTFFPIIASNGLGFHDITPDEIHYMKRSILNLHPPKFTMFDSEYTYPSFILRKYLTEFELLHLSYMTACRDKAAGGKFRPLTITSNSPVFTHPSDVENYAAILESCLIQSPIPPAPFPCPPLSYPLSSVDVVQEYKNSIYITPF